MNDDDLYFRQIAAGPMANFVYAIGCPRTRQCMLVDPAWAVKDLLELLEKDGMELTGALVTHYHPDHCGGSMMGFAAEGLPELMAQKPVPVHVNAHEAEGIKQVTGLGDSDLVRHAGGDLVKVGDVEVRLMHTPGHTPGSQCFHVGEKLVAGDTLFVEGCGRVDLPGGDPEVMFETLSKGFASLDDDTILYPGHHYSPETHAKLGRVRSTNYALQPKTFQEWMHLFRA